MTEIIDIAEQYDNISKDFDRSRIRIWNAVKDFLQPTKDNLKLLVLINEMFSDVIDYYCISANKIKELMNKEINKISLLPDYMDYLTQFNPNVKINIYNYT